MGSVPAAGQHLMCLTTMPTTNNLARALVLRTNADLVLRAFLYQLTIIISFTVDKLVKYIQSHTYKVLFLTPANSRDTIHCTY